jgi:hypothetical protein
LCLQLQFIVYGFVCSRLESITEEQALTTCSSFKEQHPSRQDLFQRKNHEHCSTNIQTKTRNPTSSLPEPIEPSFQNRLTEPIQILIAFKEPLPRKGPLLQ